MTVSNPDPTPPDDPIWAEVDARRRRRKQVLALIALELVVAGLVVAVLLARTGRGPAASRAAADRSGATTATTASTTTVARTKVDAASVTRPARRASTPSTGGTTTTGPATTTTLTRSLPDLPRADLTKPVQSPVGYYRGGKLYLEGSVPNMDVAERYYRKAVGILGEANVVVRARLDPRAPAGPAKVFVQERFAFPSGSAVVDDRYKSLLDLGVIALQRIPEAMLVITGYTDNVGPADLNQRLSEMRAQVVVDYMVARGIPADRVIAVGKGESAPVADNRTPEGRAENRRIEGVLIGIMP